LGGEKKAKVWFLKGERERGPYYNGSTRKRGDFGHPPGEGKGREPPARNLEEKKRGEKSAKVLYQKK